MILAGDVGGTKVDLALYDFEGGGLKVVRTKKYPASEFATLQEVVQAFLSVDGVAGKVQHEVVAACFGCPGPVKDGHLKLTNLPWELDARDLSKNLKIPHLFLINDLEANDTALPSLDRSRSTSWSRATGLPWVIARLSPRALAWEKLCSSGTPPHAATFRCPAKAATSIGRRAMRLRSRCWSGC